MSDPHNSPAPPPPVNQSQHPTPPPQAASQKKKPAWLLIAVSAIGGLVVGGVIGLLPYLTQDVTQNKQYIELANELASTQSVLAEADTDIAEMESSLSQVQSDLETAEADVRQLKGEVDELDARKNELDEREAALDEREDEVAAREENVTAVENEIDANTIPGNGVYEVGVDIPAGKYKTSGKVGCYYAVLNSSDTFDIANNNIVDGVATVTVKDGDYLELSRCAEWRRQ